MNDLTKKAGTHAAAVALGLTLGVLSPDKHVILDIPQGAEIVAYDANGTDGTDPALLLTIVKSVNPDGTYRITKFRSDGSVVKALGEE